MTERWRPAMPLTTFIKQNQNQQTHRSGTPQRKKRKARVFNDKGFLALSLTRPNADAKKHRSNICAIFEEQKMLLQSLALKENAAKGLAECEPQSSSFKTDLNRLKEDTCFMLQDIWNRSGGKLYV
jgi:hypothetical protein